MPDSPTITGTFAALVTIVTVCMPAASMLSVGTYTACTPLTSDCATCCISLELETVPSLYLRPRASHSFLARPIW